MGRNAQGPVLLRLLPGEAVIGAAAVNYSDLVFIGTKQSSVRQINASDIRRCNRGGIGQICIRLEKQGDQISDLVGGNTKLLCGVHKSGKSFRLAIPNEHNAITHKPQEFSSEDELAELIPLTEEE